ncbi:Cytochrome P450 [Hibiscus syriacus]|uniref:Cytochrome P450 n=1 Tax=Hibiscus syriacus TaxID=106335 RepID=A0A6A3D6N4_HIBSY|nr:Cytochrome P450 [Hibiscus syriacus]
MDIKKHKQEENDIGSWWSMASYWPPPPLRGPQAPHIILANMADKYGTVFTIKLGLRRALVVSSWEIAKECLTTNDKAFAGRPKLANMEHLGYNNVIIWTLLASSTQLYKLCNKNTLVDMQRWFRDVTLNVSIRIIVGKRDDSLEWKKPLNDFFEAIGKFVVSDVLLFLGWLDIGGDKESMKKIAKELDQVVEGWLQEHKRKIDEDDENNEQDLMGALLAILRDAEKHDADSINKATTLVQHEFNIHVGKDRMLVKESDTKNLVYLGSVIKETLRLYPAAPLSLVHEAIEDCTVDGHQVSAGTWLIVNLRKIHRDPLVWDDPFEFRPERFMTSHRDIDVRGHNFELIPSGSGRRMCPGVSFAFRILVLTLANVLHWFEFKTPSGEVVDMREAAGVTSRKATPLHVLITPRLPFNPTDQLALLSLTCNNEKENV